MGFNCIDNRQGCVNHVCTADGLFEEGCCENTYCQVKILELRKYFISLYFSLNYTSSNKFSS